MKLVLTIVLTLIVLLLLTTRESFTEVFGFSGHTTPVGTIRFDDARPNLSGYNQEETSVSNDLMEEFVLLTNDEISKRTGLCTYIIETTAVKKYSGNDKDIYECMFMTVKNNGFAFGFSVVASFEVVNGVVKLISLRSQPLDVQTPVDISPFVESTSGKEFVKYDLVKEKATPTLGELEMAKNKLQ